MEKFASIENLIVKIESDAKLDNISFIRFISVDTFSDYVMLNKTILGKCAQIRLSKYCTGVDTIPEAYEVNKAIDAITANSVLLPLSEHLRINNSNVKTTLQKLLSKKLQEKTVNKKLRLYVPIYRMKDQLLELIKSDKRVEQQIYFLTSDRPVEDYSLTIISSNYNLKISAGKKIDGYKGYLSYWEDNPAQPIVLLSAMARFYKKAKYIDNVKVYTSAYEILNHLKIVNEKIKEEYAPEEIWKGLLDSCNAEEKIDELLIKKLKCNGKSFSDIFTSPNSFIDCNAIYRWILFKCTDNIGYLKEVETVTDNLDQLLNNTISSILNFSIDDRHFFLYYSERKEILKQMKVSSFPNEFWTQLSKTKSTEAICYLTDITASEKEKIVELYSISRNVDVKILERVYANLYYYKQKYDFDQEELSEYFEQYKALKIKNEVSDEFVELVDKYASEKGKWLKLGLSNRNEIISKMYQGNSTILWFDGLGVEYLAFIKEYLSTVYPDIKCDMQIAYANLPTITDENKDFVLNRNILHINRDLDILKHKTDYPSAIPQELEIIAKQLDKLMEQITSFDRILIVADHGFTRLFKVAKFESKDVSENAKVERCGRYCFDKKNYADNGEYKGCIDDENLHIFANYNRFKLSMNLQGEVHGGATLEEVLVPIITLSKNAITEELIFTPSEQTVKAKIGERVKILFRCNKVITNIAVDAVKGGLFYENKIWCFEWDVTQAGIKIFIIKQKDLIIGKFAVEFEVKKGITSKFDI